MLSRPPQSTLTAPLCPFTTLLRSEYWCGCDAALAIGCRRQVERSFCGLDDGVKVIHVDLDPTEFNRVAKPAVAILADAAEAARAMLDALPAHNRKRESRADELTALRRSEEHTSELQSLMRISYAVFCLKKKKINK